MSLLQFQHHGYTWGIIRNQKCASTSILSYIAQVLWNADAQEIQTYNSFQKFAPEVYFKSNSNQMCNDHFHQVEEGGTRAIQGNIEEDLNELVDNVIESFLKWRSKFYPEPLDAKG